MSLRFRFVMLNLFDKGNVRTEGDDCDPVLTRRSRSAASVQTCIVAKILNNKWTFLQNFDYGNNFLHKIIIAPTNIQTLKQFQGDGELEIIGKSNVTSSCWIYFSICTHLHSKSFFSYVHFLSLFCRQRKKTNQKKETRHYQKSF